MKYGADAYVKDVSETKNRILDKIVYMLILIISASKIDNALSKSITNELLI